MSAPVLIVGCGDLGQRIAAWHRARGQRVVGVVRRPEQADTLQARGIEPWLVDLDHHPVLPASQRLYWCAPPPPEGQQDPRLASAMATLIPPHEGLLYVSTTAVYGDCAGRWITEAEPLKPSNDRGRRRLAAERSLHAWAARSGGRAMTLRVPGIYGPGRLPLERLRRGEPMLAEADCPPANRVHVEDLAEAAICIAERGLSGAAYHVSDGRPSTMADYFRRCAQHFGLPEPREIPIGEARRQLSPALLSFLEESRRLDASALRALGWRPRYPGLTEGLAACS